LGRLYRLEYAEMTTIKPSKTTSITPTRGYFGPFSLSFREHVHRLVYRGYEDARPRIQKPANEKDEEEPSITGFLAEAIRDIIIWKQKSWLKWYHVDDDPHVPTEGRSGKHRWKADLIIDSNVHGGPQYVFEAKPLEKRVNTVSGYTGSDGMGCFISGKYASRYDEAGMLGYVQNDSLAEWKNKVKIKIDRDAKELSLIGSQRDEQVIDAFPLEWVSEHHRDSVGRSIAVYHILLDCCVESES
jgi:hypothetical protein